MRKCGNRLYFHRNKGIFKESTGWTVEDCLLIFKTLSDAQAYIDKIHSGCNKKEPVIIGDIELDKEDNLMLVLR